MSLIEEALRKLQEQQPSMLPSSGVGPSPLPEAPPRPPPTPVKETPAPVLRPSAHSWPTTTPPSLPAADSLRWPLMLLAGLIGFSALSGALLTGILWSRRAPTTPPASEPMPAPTSMGLAPATAARATLPADAPPTWRADEPTAIDAASLVARPTASEHPQARRATTSRSPRAAESASAPNERDGLPTRRLVMSGIVEGLGKPYAVINGKIVTVGEQIEDATLLEIADGTVRLRRSDGQELALRVPR